MSIWVPIAMAAASMLHEKDKAAQKKRAQLPIDQAKAKYSGWTGMQPGMIEPADILGAGIQGAASGMAMNQGMENTKNQNAYLEAMKAYMNRGSAGQGTASGWSAMPNSQQDVSYTG